MCETIIVVSAELLLCARRNKTPLMSAEQQQQQREGSPLKEVQASRWCMGTGWIEERARGGGGEVHALGGVCFLARMYIYMILRRSSIVLLSARHHTVSAAAVVVVQRCPHLLYPN